MTFSKEITDKSDCHLITTNDTRLTRSLNSEGTSSGVGIANKKAVHIHYWLASLNWTPIALDQTGIPQLS
jgi:hypothetical protein